MTYGQNGTEHTEKEVGDRTQWFFDHLLGTAAVSVLIVLPLTQLVAVRAAPAFLAFAAILSLVFFLFSKKRRPNPGAEPIFHNRISKALALAVLAALGWATLSMGWSVDVGRGIYSIAIVVAGLAGAWFLGSQFAKIPFERLPIVLLLGTLASIVALHIGLGYTDWLNSLSGADQQRFDYNRIAIGLCLMVWPLALLAQRKSAYAAISVVLFLGIIHAVYSSESETAKTGLIAGICAVVFVSLFPFARKAIGVAMAGLILIMPAVPFMLDKIQHHLPQSFAAEAHLHHRLQLWKGASDLAMERWIFGWGMKSDRTLTASGSAGQYAQEAGFSPSFLSPHNLALELWVNVGLIGILLLAACLILMTCLPTRSTQHAAAFSGFQVAAFTMFLTGSSGFQGWLISAVSIAAACFISLKLQMTASQK